MDEQFTKLRSPPGTLRCNHGCGLPASMGMGPIWGTPSWRIPGHIHQLHNHLCCGHAGNTGIFSSEEKELQRDSIGPNQVESPFLNHKLIRSSRGFAQDDQSVLSFTPMGLLRTLTGSSIYHPFPMLRWHNSNLLFSLCKSAEMVCVKLMWVFDPK